MITNLVTFVLMLVMYFVIMFAIVFPFAALGLWLVSLLTSSITFSWGGAAIVTGLIVVFKSLFGGVNSKEK